MNLPIGHWTKRYWSSLRTEAIYQHCCNLAQKWRNLQHPALFRATTCKRAAKPPRAPARVASHQKVAEKQVHDGSRKSEKDHRRRSCVCATKPGSAPTRTAGSSMHVGIPNRMARPAVAHTQPWTMIKRLTDFRAITRKSHSTPVQCISLSFLHLRQLQWIWMTQVSQ